MQMAKLRFQGSPPHPNRLPGAVRTLGQEGPCMQTSCFCSGLSSFGFEDLEPGSIRWAKDEFRAVTRDKRQISGQLEVAEGISTPRRMRYRVAGGLTYEIDYAYRGDPSDTATSHLPSAFEVRSYVGGVGPGS